MKKNKVYDIFLKNTSIDGINAKYNYEFDINNSKEVEKEFLKFIYTYNYFFYSSTEKAIFTMINSYPCFLDENNLNYFLKLKEAAKINNNKDYEELVLEFLLTYYNSLNKYSHIKRIPNEEVKKYKQILTEKISVSEFYQIGKTVINFYNKIIDYSLLKNIKISISEKEKMLFNIEKFIKKDINASRVLDIFISDTVGLSSLIEYDSIKEKHIEIYKKYCLETDLESYGNDATLKIFRIVFNSGLCDDEFVKKFINRIVEKTNNTLMKIGDDSENYILLISSIEENIKDLNLIKSIEDLNTKYKEKIIECLQKVLYAKRWYLKSKKYEKYLAKQEFKFEIPNKEIDKIIKDVNKNFAKLYNHTRINFTKELEESIKSYSDHALLYHVTRINIYENEIYKIESKKDNNTVYKQYYDSVGEKYISNNYKKLMNILDKDYYEVMLTYLKSNYSIQINLLKLILKDNIINIKNSINKARLYSGEIRIDNLYEEMMAQIIGIEANIFKLAEKRNFETKNIGKMLENLFEAYKNDDLYRNGIMYIYYVLYCKEGVELRNKVAHGELLSKDDFSGELLMIYSCVIIINYIVGIEINGNR